MKSALLTLCLSLTVGISSVFAKDMTEAECVDFLRKALSSEFMVEQTKRTFPNLGNQKIQLFQEHYRWFSNNDKLLRKLAHDFNQMGLLKVSSNQTYAEDSKLAKTAMLVMFGTYYQKGLLKSSPEDLRKYSEASLRLVRLMPYGQCKKYSWGPGDSQYYAQLLYDQRRLYDSYSLSEMREYFRHFRRVVDNALDDRISERQLDSVNLNLATKALENAIADKLISLPTKKRERLANVFIYPESATDKDACEAGILAMEALDSLDGRLFVLASTYMLYESMK